MSMNHEFENVWKKFMVLCHAKLWEKSKQCSLTAAAAEMSVKDAAFVWFDQYEACGQWLKKLEQKQPQAAVRIKDILENISLEEAPEKKVFPDLGVLGVAVGGAAAGIGVGAFVLHLGTVGKLISAAAPAAALYPAMKSYQKSDKEKAQKETIGEYLAQMDLLKEQICGILEQDIEASF